MAAPLTAVLAKAPVAIGAAKAAYRLYKKEGVKATVDKYGQAVAKFMKKEFPKLAGPIEKKRKASDRETDLPRPQAFMDKKGKYLTRSEGSMRDATARAARRSAATEFLNPREKVKASKSKPFTGKDDNNEGTIDAAQVKRAAKDVGLPFKRGGSPMRKKAKR